MRFLLLALTLFSSAAFADGKVICQSINRDDAYTLAAELQSDGVFKGFYAVRIQRPNVYILAVGTAAAQEAGNLITFFEVNQNGQLRAGTGENLLINGESSQLNLNGDANVALKCAAQ